MNCSKRILLHYHRYVTRGLASKVKRPLASKFDFKLDEDLSSALVSGSLRPRDHPGIQTIKPVSLPSKLQQAVSVVLADYPEKTLENDAKNLSNYIWARQLPVEGVEYDDVLRSVEEKVIREETIDPLTSEISEETQNRLLESRKNKIINQMRKRIYHWKPISYSKYKSILYLKSRFCPDYAALLKVFKEIKKRDPHFSPKTMVDFGSGVGTGMWAMDSIWPKSCKEVVCVDSSSEMNDLADQLLRGGNINDIRLTRPAGTFFKQFLPMSDVLKFDLVIASRSLFELPDMESRLRTLDVLWRKTDGYLVIIEAGTNAGYKAVLEARDYILQLGKESQEEANALEGHVLGPCPHEYFCPRYLDGSYIPCNFEVSYRPFTVSKNTTVVKDIFSYVVLKKGKSLDTENYPRLVQHPMLRTKHIICRVCTKYGTLKELVATKRKHSKECYRVLKCSKLGDLLPVILPESENVCTTPDDVESDVSDNDSIEAKVV